MTLLELLGVGVIVVLLVLVVKKHNLNLSRLAEVFRFLKAEMKK